MLKYKILLLSFLCLKSLNLVSQTQLSSNNHSEILIQIAPDLSIDAFINEIKTQNKWEIFLKKTTVPEWGVYLIGIEKVSGTTDDILEKLNAHNAVIGASFNQPVEFRNTEPNDTLYSKQWHFNQIGLAQSWDITTGGQTINQDEIVVAIVDSGFNPNHPDFEGQIWNNPVDFTANPNPTHGTKVSGIIGAKGNNTIGVTGVNWDIKMMLLSIRYPDEIANAYRFAYNERKLYNETNGLEGSFVVVVNGSFGFNNSRCSDFPILANLMDTLGQEGILYVASAPNTNNDINAVGDFPSECPSDYLITVTSSNRDDEKADDAAFGQTTIDLAAPGTEIFSTYQDGSYQLDFNGGTSFAAPHVSGAIALLYSVPCQKIADLALEQPSYAALLMKDAILNGVDKLSNFEFKTVTEGRLNILNSLNYLHGYCIAKEKEEQKAVFVDTYLKDKNLVRVYPNPSNDFISIDYSVANFQQVTINIFNTLGQLMWKETAMPIPFKKQAITLDISAWPNGTYFVTIVDFEKKSTLKFSRVN